MRSKLLYHILLIVLIVASCKKSDNKIEVKNPDPESDIYITGSVSNTSNVTTAAYWKNGVETLLNSSSSKSSASGITVQSNDTYISGTREVNNQLIACYWKNGNVIDLTTTAVISVGNPLINGGDLYIIGQEYNSTTPGRDAIYWKNGVKIYLPVNNSDYSGTTGIAANGNDIYITGFIKENGNLQAVVWKNGVLNKLPYSNTNIYNSDANCIAIVGNDVYVGGNEYNQQNYLLNSSVCWKNGIISSTISGAAIFGMMVKGSDIYTSGGDAALTKAMYWKNGNATTLNSGTAQFVAKGIIVYQNDIYVIGGGFASPSYIYWKNGMPIKLTNYASALLSNITLIPHL